MLASCLARGLHSVLCFCALAGFAKLPKGISISPGDGFGTLLPQEALPLTVSFMPPLTGPYTFQLECRTPLNTHFTLPCAANATLPAITLSHNYIQVVLGFAHVVQHERHEQ